MRSNYDDVNLSKRAFSRRSWHEVKFNMNAEQPTNISNAKKICKRITNIIVTAGIVIGVANVSIRQTYAQNETNDNTLIRSQKILKMITNTADHICEKPPLRQTSSGVTLSGDAKAKVGGLVGKIANLGINGNATYHNKKSFGVLEKDLAQSIEMSNNCSLAVFKTLSAELLPKPPSGINVTPNHQIDTLRSLISGDIVDVYKHVGWQIAFFRSWGYGPTRQLLRINGRLLVATTPNHSRTVSTSIDPAQLPKTQYYKAHSQEIMSLGPRVAPIVDEVFSDYDQYKAALSDMLTDPRNLLFHLDDAMSTGTEVLARGREVLCLLGTTPPTLFPQGGFPEPIPPNCAGISSPGSQTRGGIPAASQ